MKAFNAVLAIGLMLGVGQTANQPAAAQTGTGLQSPKTTEPLRIRKEWDDLTPSEKKAFIHAIAVMKKKSRDNIYDRSGFLWHAWVHNCPTVSVARNRPISLTDGEFKKLMENNTYDSCNPLNFVKIPADAMMHPESPGECEHRKDIFLQWHRAELYFFEQALRAADPEGTEDGGPSTRDVSLPYWNFTKQPTGKRYPIEFEDPASVLFDKTRNQNPLPGSLPTASPYLLAYLIHNTNKSENPDNPDYRDWRTFGGDSVGGVGQGYLETKIHNRMHGTYIGGHMADNAKAAMDPIFYLFHNFLDFALDAWIREHGEGALPPHGSSRDSFLRAQQDGNLPRPPDFSEGRSDPVDPKWGSYIANMGQAKIYLDTKKLGYEFAPYDKEGKPQVTPKTEIDLLIAKHEGAGFRFGDNGISLMSALLSHGSGGPAANPAVKLTLKGGYKIPGQPIQPGKAALLRFTRTQINDDYSFCADVYLYPGDQVEDISNESFRDRWLVATTAHWVLGHGQHGSGIVLNDDITRIINSLVATNGGKMWNITLAVSNCGNPVKPVEKDFSPAYVMVQP